MDRIKIGAYTSIFFASIKLGIPVDDLITAGAAGEIEIVTRGQNTTKLIPRSSMVRLCRACGLLPGTSDFFGDLRARVPALDPVYYASNGRLEYVPVTLAVEMFEVSPRKAAAQLREFGCVHVGQRKVGGRFETLYKLPPEIDIMGASPVNDVAQLWAALADYDGTQITVHAVAEALGLDTTDRGTLCRVGHLLYRAGCIKLGQKRIAGKFESVYELPKQE